MKIEIYIATHKSINFPNNKIYIPIQVGSFFSNKKFNYLTDDMGENISHLNKNFCEITALYWIWKNTQADILGLVHYRRYLISKNGYSYANSFIISDKEIENTLLTYDIIMARSYLFRYLGFIPVTIKFNYFSRHYKNDWFILKGIIQKKYPEYLKAFNSIEKQFTMHSCNIFIGKRDFVDHYCSWLFDILFTAQELIDISHYDSYQARIFGFMAERLLNVYVLHHKLKIKTYPVLITE